MKHRFIVIVPEFSRSDFPGAASYNTGFFAEEDGTLRPRTLWSFAAIEPLFDETRRRFPGTLILAGDYDATRAETDLAAGRADLIAFGRPFIANPDLPARLAAKSPLAEMQADKLYTPGPEGYADYPALSESAAA